MRILVDENIPLSTVHVLRALNHDLPDLRGTPHEDAPDEGLWQIAESEQ